MVHLTSVPFDIQPTFPDFLLNGEHPSSLSVRLHRTLFIVASDLLNDGKLHFVSGSNISPQFPVINIYGLRD